MQVQEYPLQWTVQFRFKDIQFHYKEGAIPQDAPTKVFLQDRVFILFLDMQKNSVWGNSTTMEATNLKHRNPVSAAVRRFLHLCQNNT